MKKNILNKLAIISCLLVMVGCAAKKQLVKPNVTPAATVKPVSKMDAIAAHQLNFATLSAKASTKLNIDGNSNDVTLNIRINHDRQIWVSITAILGIEVARAMITPDSLLVINKLQGVYIKKPFSYIYKYTNKQINYKTLESILVGNVMPEILKDNSASFPVDNQVSGNLQDLFYKLMLNPDLKVTQLNLDNQNQGQSLQVNTNGFTAVDNRIVPSQIDIQSASQNKKIQVNLHYTKVDLDQQLQYPFSIPERYTPADEN
ncbi:MAG TPA: DUF4292 domain-containing protein [Mucilaginibacter sp.]